MLNYNQRCTNFRMIISGYKARERERERERLSTYLYGLARVLIWVFNVLGS